MLNSLVINDVACFNFDVLVWPVAVGTLIDTSSGRCTSLPTKEVSLPRREILSSSGSRYSDYLPSSDMISSSTASCISHDLIEEASAGAILKPGRGAVFVCACSFLTIWRDLLAMVTVSSSLTCAREISFLKICLIKISHLVLQ